MYRKIKRELYLLEHPVYVSFISIIIKFLFSNNMVKAKNYKGKIIFFLYYLKL